MDLKAIVGVVVAIGAIITWYLNARHLSLQIETLKRSAIEKDSQIKQKNTLILRFTKAYNEHTQFSIFEDTEDGPAVGLNINRTYHMSATVHDVEGALEVFEPEMFTEPDDQEKLDGESLPSQGRRKSEQINSTLDEYPSSKYL